MRSIKRLQAMHVVVLMLLIIAWDIKLNPGPTGSSSHLRTDINCTNKSADLAQTSPHHTLRAGGQFFRACPSSTVKVHVRLKICKDYGFVLRHSGGSAGTTAAAGFDVSKSGGRPTGTNAAAGFNVGSGRPTGTSAKTGFKVSHNRLVGTTKAKGSKVGSSPGRPKGTTADKGYSTAVAGGHPSGASRRDHTKKAYGHTAPCSHKERTRQGVVRG